MQIVLATLEYIFCFLMLFIPSTLGPSCTLVPCMLVFTYIVIIDVDVVFWCSRLQIQMVEDSSAATSPETPDSVTSKIPRQKGEGRGAWMEPISLGRESSVWERLLPFIILQCTLLHNVRITFLLYEIMMIIQIIIMTRLTVVLYKLNITKCNIYISVLSVSLSLFLSLRYSGDTENNQTGDISTEFECLRHSI